MSGGTLTLSRHNVHYIALGPATYNNDTYTLIVSGLTGATAANIVYDQAPPNVVPIATGVAITGTATAGLLLTGNYVYDDGESDPQGGSTFKWYADSATNGNTKLFLAGATAGTYTPIATDVGKYLFFCVTPVASAGASPGNETCSAASALVSATVPGAPAAPTANAGNGQASVSWAAPASNGGAAVTGYRVQMSASASGPFADATGSCAPASTTTSTATTCTAVGLANGTAYYFKVSAINSVGQGAASAASAGFAPIAQPLINPFSSLPSLPGVGSRPNVLNLSSGQGPAMTNCLADTVRAILGSGFNYLGQSPDGAAKFGDGNSVLAFYPTAVDGTINQVLGVRLQGSNVLSVATSCGRFSAVPAVSNLTEFAALLTGMGLSANMNAQGVLTVNVNGVIYVVRPDYLVTKTAGTGSASVVLGSDGLYRFTDSAGFVQVLRAAFLDPAVLSVLIARDFAGTTVFQTDGTALVTLVNRTQFTLAPDVTLSGIPPQFFSAEWWQIANRYFYKVASFPNASQGFGAALSP